MTRRPAPFQPRRYFDDLTGTWVHSDAYYDEVIHNGVGEQCTQADALTAVRQFAMA